MTLPTHRCLLVFRHLGFTSGRTGRENTDSNLGNILLTGDFYLNEKIDLKKSEKFFMLMRHRFY